MQEAEDEDNHVGLGLSGLKQEEIISAHNKWNCSFLFLKNRKPKRCAHAFVTMIGKHGTLWA
jgi:hypothetical protein